MLAIIAAVLWLPPGWGIALVLTAGLVGLGEIGFWLWYSKRRRATTGVKALVGAVGIAATACEPDGRCASRVSCGAPSARRERAPAIESWSSASTAGSRSSCARNRLETAPEYTPRVAEVAQQTVSGAPIEWDTPLFRMAVAQLDQALEHADVDPVVATRLHYPELAVVLSVPIQLDDGTCVVFPSYRVQHSSVLGPTKGGSATTRTSRWASAPRSPCG